MAVFDGKGVCVFNKGGIGEDSDFRDVIDKALSKVKRSNLKKKAFVDSGTVYAPKVKKEKRIVRERMPRLAAGPDGEVHLVYVTDEGGSNDIYLRSFVEGKWREDVPLAATKSDEYAPAIVAQENGDLVVAYVSDHRDRYDISVVRVKKGKPGKPKQVTKSRDDAMAPALCAGGKGEVWLAWYEWAVMGQYSRDREIFLSRSSGKGWSKPVQVSPKNVPTYEDHADPVVSADGKGGVWVAWAWDYHGTLSSKPPVDENSIFVRHVDKKMKPGDILAAGFRGEGLARDYAPTLAVTRGGVPWVAWDNSHKASAGYGAKAVFLNSLDVGEDGEIADDFSDQVEVAVNMGRIGSPRLILDRDGRPHLLWCQETSGGWEVCIRRVGPGEQGEARRLKLTGKNPRYPDGCFDSKGKFWVAYTVMEKKKWQVRAVKAVF